jgi:hypothetical protein
MNWGQSEFKRGRKWIANRFGNDRPRTQSPPRSRNPL